MSYLISALISAAIAFGSFLIPHAQTLTPQMQAAMQQYLAASEAPSFGATQPFAGNTYNLAGAGISGSATTITLTSLTLKQTGQPILTSDLVGTGGTFYVTLEPGSNTKQEIVGCTGVLQGASSASLTGCTRGLSPLYPYTASSSLAFSHGGGSQAIFSDPPQLFNQYLALGNNNQTITGTGLTVSATTTFSNGILYGYDCDAGSSNFAGCDKHYIDTRVSAGAANANDTTAGLVQTATGAQASAGTSIGSTGARLALGANIATSTCQVAGNNVLVASSTTGKLSGGCLDTTSNAETWTQKSTFTATTSIAASGTTTAALTLNGVNYALPPSDAAASSSVLASDAHGDLTWQNGHNRYSAYNAAGISKATTGYATTSLLTIPANVMTASSTIEIKGNASCAFGASTGGTCTFRVRSDTGVEFGNFAIASKAQGTSGTDESGYFDFMILPNNSVAVQQTIYNSIVVGLDFSGAGSTAALIGNRGAGSAGTSAINLANATTIDMVVQSADGNETAAITGLSVIVQQ